LKYQLKTQLHQKLVLQYVFDKILLCHLSKIKIEKYYSFWQQKRKKNVSFEPISHKVDIFIFEKNVFQLAYQCFLFCFRKINLWKIRNNKKQKKTISRNTISLVTQHINVLGKEVQVIITCQVFAITPTYNWDI
jgi:hypothetical protein